MNKKYFVSLLVVSGFLVAASALAQNVDLGVPDPGTLPTSRLYFLKEWGRGIKMFFTFDPIKKADLELNILNEKAAETQKISDTDAQNIDAVKKALENYKTAHNALVARLNALKDTSKNPNIDKLLSGVAEKTIKHEQLLDGIAKKFENEKEIKDLAESNKDDLDDVVSAAAAKDEPGKFTERFKKEAEGALKEDADLQKKAAETIKHAEEKLSELGKKMAVASSTPEVANKYAEAKDHLAKAKTAFAAKDYGEAFGQARSAEVLARNGMKMLEKMLENENEEENKNEGEKDDDRKSTKPQAAPFPKPIPQDKPIPKGAEIKFEMSTTVVIDENGFNPREIGIKKGGKVTWVNKSQSQIWPASNPHPIHTDYSGFDSRLGFANGESYSFTFDKVGSWGYHNHLNPSMKGEVKVVE
ncbi:MAG: DUF5667 domain-containing protein [Candidatus Giovannonibacteria bacterium]|nr:DUF5667 domain-containing protein [Candidatus Giovannonibacteria bacterium]